MEQNETSKQPARNDRMRYRNIHTYTHTGVDWMKDKPIMEAGYEILKKKTSK